MDPSVQIAAPDLARLVRAERAYREAVENLGKAENALTARRARRNALVRVIAGTVHQRRGRYLMWTKEERAVLDEAARVIREAE